MTKKICFLLISAVFAFALSGCISHSKTSTYILCPDESAAKQYNALVRVNAIELPEYLDRSMIMVRVSKHTIGSLKGHQWVQNFKKMIQNSLAANLLLRSNGSSEAPQFSVFVKIERFELDSQNTLKVSAECSLYTNPPKGAKQFCKSFPFTTNYNWDGVNVDALIGLHDKALSDMAELIAGKAGGL